MTQMNSNTNKIKAAELTRDHLLANVSRPKEEVQKRVDRLKKEFPEYKYAIRPNDNRFSIVIDGFDGRIDQPTLDQMVNMANGL